MNIVAVVGMRWIARGARTGPPSVTLWVLAWIAFFVPLAVACSTLAQPLSRTGRRVRVGPPRVRPGSRVHLRLVPLGQQSLLLSLASCCSAPRTSRRWAARGGRRWERRAWYSVAFVLAGIWIAAGINIIGLRLGKWLQNAGSLGVWIPAGLLIGCGAYAFARFGSATPFTPDTMVPRGASARHGRALVGDVLRVLRLRDHVAHRPGDPRSRAHDPARHLHRRRGDDA